MKKNLHLPKFFLILPTLALVGLGVFALIQPAAAMSDYIETLLMGGFSAIMAGLIELLGNTLLVVINIFLGVVEYNGFSDATAVIKGWVIMRDVGNMFFVIILLIIAISTILNIETYQYKKLLPRLLIMALLINFSKAIAAFLIDVSQIAMLTFVSGFAHTAASNFTTAFGLNEFMSLVGENEWGNRRELDSSLVFQAYVLALVFMLVALITITIITLVLMFRIVALWILIVLSPVAYLAAAFPAGQRYSQQWWQKFGHYVVSGPVLAFFVWIALTVTAKHTGNLNKELEDVNLSEEEILDEDSELSAAATKLGKSESVMSFILGVAMLMGGLVATQQLAVAGGKMAGNWMGRLQSAGMKPFRLAGKGGWGTLKAAGRKWDRTMAKISSRGKPGILRRMAGFMSPTVVKKSLAGARAEAEREAFPQAIGRMQNFINKRVRGKETIDHEKIAFQTEVATMHSELEKSNLSAPENAAAMDKAIKNKNTVEIAAMGKVLTKENQWDDYMEYMGLEYTPENVRLHMKERLEPALGEDMASNIGVMWTNYAETVQKYRNINFASSTTFDKKGKPLPRGQIRNKFLTDSDEAKEYWKTIQKRTAIRTILANTDALTYREKNKEGLVGRYSEEGKNRKSVEDSNAKAKVLLAQRIEQIPPRYFESIGIDTNEKGEKTANIDVFKDVIKAGAIDELYAAINIAGFDQTELENIESQLKAIFNKPDEKDMKGNNINVDFAGAYERDDRHKNFKSFHTIKNPPPPGKKKKKSGGPMAAPADVGEETVETVPPGTMMGQRTAMSKKRQQVGLGVDFNDTALNDLGLRQDYVGYNLQGNKKNEAVDKLKNYYHNFLRNTVSLSEEEMLKEVDKLGQSLETAETIRLTNVTHPKTDKFAVARHELAEPEVDELEDEDIDEILGTVDPNLLGQLKTNYSQRWGGLAADQSGRDLEREIVTDMVAGYDRPAGDMAKHPASLFVNKNTAAKLKGQGLIKEKEDKKGAGGVSVSTTAPETGRQTKSIPEETISVPATESEAETISALERLTENFNTSGMELSLETIANNLQTLQEELKKLPQINTEKISQAITQTINSTKGPASFNQQGQRLEVSRQLFNINKNLKEITRGLSSQQEAGSAEKAGQETKKLVDDNNLIE